MENKEKYIIEQLHNHRETVDTDDLWSNLAGSIPRKENKRRAIIWFCSGLLFVSLLGFIGYMIIDKPEGIKISNGLQNNEFAVAELLPPIASLTEDEDLKSIVNDDLEKRIEHNSEAHVDNILSATKELEATKEAKEQQGLFTKNNAQTIVTPEYPESVVYHENELIEMSRNDVYSLINEKNVADKTNGRLFETKQDVDKKVLIGRNENVSFLDPLDFNKLSFRADLGINRTVFESVDLLTEQSMKVNKWSMFVNTGTSLITRNLATSDPEYIDRQNRRRQIENVRGGLEITVGLSHSLTPSLSMSSGLIYGQIFEQSTYLTSYLIETEEEQITSIIHTQDGSVNSVTEIVKLYSDRETNEIRNNTFRSFSIPVTLEYRLIENDKYRLNVNGTFAYSFYQRYSGFTSLNANQPSYNLAIDTNNDFKRSAALSYGFGLDVSRRISPIWDLNFGISSRRLQGITSETNPIDQNYSLYTCTFGISRKI
ncbi:MAG: hypothetical protein ACJA1A_001230 [Saprospiraceae bacterium]|jgi:hypothetical protein